MTSAETR